MIIGISGKAGAGKDLAGKIIQFLIDREESKYSHPINEEFFEVYARKFDQKYCDWRIVKFADKLKDIVGIILGCTRKKLEDREFKDSPLPKQWNNIVKETNKVKASIRAYREHSLTPREILQKLGTDVCRAIHPNTWINATMNDYDPSPLAAYHTDYKNLVPNWIITDVRFPNEADTVVEKGGFLIRINRPGYGTSMYALANDHESETALDAYNFDIVISNDGTITDLISKIYEVLVQKGIIHGIC